MKLQPLLEGPDTKRELLELQQGLIDHLDFEIECELVKGPAHVDEGVMRLSFPDWSCVDDQWASINFIKRDTKNGAPGYAVGIEGLSRSHTYITPDDDVAWYSLSDPALIKRLGVKICQRAGIIEKAALSERAKYYSNKLEYHFGLPEEDDFTPFHTSPWFSDDHQARMGEAALKGKHIVCMGIRKPYKNVLGGANALNKFNDDVLRKSPRPSQLAQGTTTDFTWFLYATEHPPRD